ncbi:trigger factor [Mycoplasma sp. ATU-Cv-508]|uniref:trigger factor n=1 Tax=Mycoplasma sp. ATU-Cv-508 TaxID=2048001 RepID=UPI000FDF1CB1
MKKVFDAQKSELVIVNEVESAQWVAAQKNSFEQLRNSLLVKGFRKGQVPEAIAKQHISKHEIQAKAIDKILDDLVKKARELISPEDKILDQPVPKINKISDKELAIELRYAVYPKINLANYKNLGIKYESVKIEESQIEKELENLREKHALLVPYEGKIAKGHLVKFDFEGFIEGKPFENGRAKDYVLEIGSQKFIPGFEEQMIGLAKGQESEIKVNFPDDYNVASLKGKAAVFKIKIHEIKVKELPELDDKLAQEVGLKNVSNLKELRQHIREMFVEQNAMQSRHKFIQAVFEKLKSNTKVVVPDVLIDKEVQAIKEQFSENLKRQNYTLKDYASSLGLDERKLNDHFREQAVKRLVDSFIFAEIARAEKIRPTEEDFEQQYQKFAKMYNKPIEEIKKMIGKNYAQVPIINDKVINRLIELNA